MSLTDQEYAIISMAREVGVMGMDTRGRPTLKFTDAGLLEFVRMLRESGALQEDSPAEDPQEVDYRQLTLFPDNEAGVV